jgi:hypothetical protein
MIAAWAVLRRVIGTLGETPDVAGQLYYLGNEIANFNASMRPKLPFLAFQVFASLRESGDQVRIGGPSFRSPAVDGGLYCSQPGQLYVGRAEFLVTISTAYRGVVSKIQDRRVKRGALYFVVGKGESRAYRNLFPSDRVTLQSDGLF